jgi:hypothetical protein
LGFRADKDVLDDFALAMTILIPYPLTLRFLNTIACPICNRKQSLEYTLAKLVWPTQADFFLVLRTTAKVTRMR